ncbi:MAG: hypothetical protein PSV17_00415 [Methylotenera sp.]|uniref:hypothetical protein n=1 Tax=Methylotenera sp. TaxID=2051956 RepID=UPI00248716DF|nr:hypothetical protein [Methylotenera sp.]MDI1307879.1 hypothetical protein [Methylotenera sp.]
MKSFFNFIFPKKTTSNFKNSRFQNSTNISQPSKISEIDLQPSIFDTLPANDDYEVAEISLEEFESTTMIERRKLSRNADEARTA